ncbi:uroporphyrinogen-III synthase [Trichocoleus desertorum AS-A10]|uniref:uroporphyrinogen-III synthase n=1 Tax=Trichocoleus desertorum TaxID=1481672 RepID=UPI00329A1DD7
MLHPSVQLPLQGKRILLTAPRGYAARLSQALIAEGALPILMPAIETCHLSNFTELYVAFEYIEQYDWIAFTSRNGIEAFFEQMRSLELSFSLIKHCKICAIGKDAEKLSEFGLKADLIPKEPSPQGIIAELAKIPDIADQVVLVPVPEVVGVPEPDVVPNFVANLQQLGMIVHRVPTYQTRNVDKALYTVELALLKQGQIDAIAFSSTAEVSSFLQMVESEADCQNCAIACFGPYTAANAEKLGLSVQIVAADFSSFAGFAEAIARFFVDQAPEKFSKS